jgi:hypothetical protein
VTALTFAPENDRVGRAHLLDDIIENLEARRAACSCSSPAGKTDTPLVAARCTA